MNEDHRAHRRYTVEIAAEVTAGVRTLAAATQNVSEGGVGLVLDAPLEEGARVQLALFLTQDGIEDPDQEPFEVKATIAWSAAQGDGVYVAGVRFGALSPSERATLQRFLGQLA